MDKIVFHSIDCDGIISKCLMQSFLPEGRALQVFGYNYEKNYDHDMLKNAYWVDCTPELEEDFVFGLENNCIYIDHHESRKPLFDKYKEKYCEQLLYGDSKNGWSGASLVAGYLEREIKAEIPYFLEVLIYYTSIADTWQKNNIEFNDARDFSKFVQMIGVDFKLPNTHNKTLYLLELVKCLANSNRQKARKMADFANIKIINNLRVAFINSLDISDASEILRNERNIDLIVGYEQSLDYYDFSFRSAENYDCSALAKKIGGGGHKCASGANEVRCENIYKLIENLIQE